MSIVRKIAKNTGIIITGNVVFKLISLVVTIYLVRYLGVADFGKFNFLFAYLSFFTLITEFGLSTILIREISQNKDKTAELVGNALSITFLLSILSFILSITMISLISYPADTTFYIYVVSISIFFISYSGVYASIFRANLKMEYNQYAKIISRIFSAILIFFVIFSGGKLIHIVIIMVVAEFINALLNYSYSKKFINPSFKLNIDIWKHLLTESFPIALSSMFAVIYHNIDIIMLSSMRGDTSVGYYSAALKVVAPLGLITSGLTMSLFPVISSYAKNSLEKLSNAYVISLKYILLISLPITVGVSFTSKEIISFVFGSEFMPAAIVLVILIWVQLFVFTNTINIDTLISLHKQNKVTKVAFAGSILNILLNSLLIPKYDFYGASFATVLTEIIILLLLFPSVLKKVNISSMNKSIIKILLANLILSIYLFILLPKFNFYVIIFTSVFVYFTFYFLIGGVNDMDKKIFKKLFHH
ncbi:flippase [Methanosarcina mazei]|uniref:Uncharacterized protein n=1 Tax=Methanosarcina mazei TaxID=2209 RepID=A0A0F8NCS2_METMZ|nr:flippase [Methanosarcina mazei]KKH38755.1 hypothetical protein DU71_13705 [Methanosarcina mazei]KKH45773.1 hypothetical protein DU72_00890 [Methanosarcina mazei]